MKYTVDEIAEMRKYVASLDASSMKIKYPNESWWPNDLIVEARLNTFMLNGTLPSELSVEAELKESEARSAVSAHLAYESKIEAEVATRIAKKKLDYKLFGIL